ncbi:MAG: 2OG-Fe(II) oxygenase [Deltaproteobacteria bacterium]|nr:2OG-Fe(II) oxygenase [Deltaproteobacteria bacterium]
MRPRPIEDPAAERFERLELATHGIAAAFACGGSLTTDRPLTLRFADGVSFVVQPGPDDTPWNAPSLAPLIQRCDPAPFGKGRSTRYDRRVRNALQLRAQGDALRVLDFDLATSGILEAVRKALTPDDPNALTAELYGLHVYSAGGHFVQHKDTPRGKDMLGTLVVCLPIGFSGGELELTHRGAIRTFDWGSRSRSPKAPIELRWAAFFGDVDHEVKEVRVGHRITLTWLLRRGSGLPRPLPDGPPTDPLASAFAAAVADPDFLRNGGILGFRCEHMYSETPGFVRAIPPLDARSVLKLKGLDQHIAAMALAAGLSVALKPYVIEPGLEEQWRLQRFPTTKEAGVFRSHRLTPFRIESALPIESHVECFSPDREVHWLAPPLKRDHHGGTATTLLGAPEYSTTGYFGNEGGDGEFYLYGALLVTVPSWAQRRPKRALKKGGTPSAKPATTTVPKRVAVAPASRRPGSKTPTGEFMTAELHAMGHGPADIRRMLKEGALERTGYGWYRFVR